MVNRNLQRRPEQYGITYQEEIITIEDILSHLDTLLQDDCGLGFFLEADHGETGEYPLGVTVHYHPWAQHIELLLENNDAITAYGLDWTPENVWGKYDNTPYLNLINPGALDCWIEVTDDDYDTVLDALEHTPTNDELYPDSNWGASYPDYTLEVHSADSDHCHFSITFEN